MRLAFLLAAWCQLRRGEILGLQRRDIDPLHGTLKVARALVVRADQTHTIGPPKTEAGRRTIAIPPNLLPAILSHLRDQVGSDPDAWLFDGAQNSRGVTNPGASDQPEC